MVPIRGAFGSSPLGNAATVEPISNMLQENQDIGSMDWMTWDKMVLQFNDPDPTSTEWTAGPQELDFVNTGGFDPMNFNAGFDANMMMGGGDAMLGNDGASLNGTGTLANGWSNGITF